MIITANTLGIKIDLSDSSQAVKDRFETPFVTVLAGSLDTISVRDIYELGAGVQLKDSTGDNLYIHNTEVTSINGVTTFNDAESVFNALSNAILNI